MSRPALVEFDEDIVPLIFDEQKDAIILFTDDIDQDFVRVFEDAAQKLRGEAIFVISGTMFGIQERLADFIGIDISQAPSIRYLQTSREMKKFTFEHSLHHMKVPDLYKFITEAREGKLRQSLKSQPVPKINVNSAKSPVFQIVGSTFN